MTTEEARIINIMIADDHDLFADGLELILSEPPFHVVGKATNGKVMLQLLNNIVPDLILLDINMGVMNGIETAFLIKKRFQKVKTVFISMEYDAIIKTIIKNNDIDGYLPKSISSLKLKEVLKEISDGNKVFIFPDEPVNNQIFSQHLGNQFFSQFKLTRTELEIIGLIAKGDSTKIIASKKNLSYLTIETHRKNIFRKINAKNMAEVVAFAFSHKLIE